jgi:tetratricopeptide (TPR) repeat protein
MMAAVLTLVLLATPSEALSRAHFVKAQKAFAQHDWRRALDEFTGAVESAPNELPDFWFDIAQCHRNLGHARQAAAAFTRYLLLAPDAPDRDKVRAQIVSLGGKPPPDDAAAPVAATPIAPGPRIDLAPPPPADAPPVAAAPVDAAPAVTAAAMPATAPVDAPPPPRAHRHWKAWTGVAVGVAVAALAVGLGVGLGTQSSSSSAMTPPTPSLGSAATFDTRGH